MKHRFVWHDLLSEDARAAIEFYMGVIGWKTRPFDDSPTGAYTMWVGDQGPLGGVMQITQEDAARGERPHWMGHVEVESLEAMIARAKELGGSVVVPPTPIPGVGHFAIVADPCGGSLSLYQPDTSEAPHTPKPGEVTWAELHSEDPETALAFYGALLGWARMQEMDMGPAGTYVIFGEGDDALGGIMKKLGPIAGWIYYVEVEDIDAAIARAKQSGGTLLHGPAPVPGGRMAQLADPQGAVFGLHGSE